MQTRYDVFLDPIKHEATIQKFTIPEALDGIEEFQMEYNVRELHTAKPTCNCPAFIYRGRNCKHLRWVKTLTKDAMLFVENNEVIRKV